MESSRPDDSNGAAWAPLVKEIGLEDMRTSRPGRKLSHQLAGRSGGGASHLSDS